MRRTAARSILVEDRTRSVAIAVALVTITAWCLVSAAAASAGSAGTLVLSSSGLPKGQSTVVQLKGPSGKRIVRFAGRRSLKVPPGHYAVVTEQVSIGAGVRGIQSGAVAYPSKKKAAATVKAGARASVVAHYRGIVNPSAAPLPARILGFVGDREDPSDVFLPAKGKAPEIGTIYVSGPTSLLPRGLISKVTAVKQEPKKYVASLEAVPVTDAVPSLQFEGNIDFQPAAGATGSPDALARASSSCSPPQLLKFGAHLDSFQLRQASVDVFPPQMRLSLAIRSTESMGLAAAAAGINCNWTLAELGPFDATLPLGPLLVPVYATLPLSAGVHINGSLNAATINVASTTVASMAAGSQNSVSLEQQGSNVWTSGVLSLSGSAKLSASIGVQAGIGVANVGNVHVNAGFGPEFEWSSGHDCEVYANLGSLSAGVSVLGRTLDTPSWTPIRPRLWTGCASGGGGSGGSKGGGSGGTGGSSSGETPGGAGAGAGGPTAGSTFMGLPVVQISLGWLHGCALQDNGIPYCWGEPGPYTEAVLDPPDERMTQIASGAEFTCGLRPDGTAICWGYEGWPYQAGTPSGSFIELTAGMYNVCGLRGTGEAACWGSDHEGQSSPPSGPFTELAAGGEATCGLRPGGSIVCWGGDEYGQADPPAGSFTAISMGTFTGCAIHPDGTVACWGRGEDGSANPPPEAFTQISIGDEMACGLRPNRTVDCWGGIFDTEETQAAMSGEFLQISSGLETVCGIAVGTRTIQCGGGLDPFGVEDPPR